MRIDIQIPKKYHQAIIKRLTSNSIFNNAKYDEKRQMFVHKFAFIYTPVSEKEVSDAWHWVLNEETKKENTSDGGNYWVWAMLVGFLFFAGIWIYAMTIWGLLWGLMFGWIPALIGGVVAGVLWPLVVIVVILLFINS